MTVSLGSYVLSNLGEDPKEILLFTADHAREGKPEILQSILIRRVDAYLRLSSLADAESEFEILRQLFQKHRTGIEAYSGALERMAKACGAAGNVARQMRYMKEAIDLGSRQNYEDLKALAKMAFDGRAYAEARPLFESLLGAFAKEVKADKDPELEYKIQFCILRCWVAEGNHDRALQTIHSMTNASRDPEVAEIEADLIFEKARRLTGNERVERIQAAEAIFGKLAKGYKNSRPADYHRTLTKWCRCLFEHSAGQTTLARFFKAARRSGETIQWEQSKYKDELKNLMDRMDEKLPRGR
jgi:tetratricopeptide (TPR) repeat protein